MKLSNPCRIDDSAAVSGSDGGQWAELDQPAHVALCAQQACGERLVQVLFNPGGLLVRDDERGADWDPVHAIKYDVGHSGECSIAHVVIDTAELVNHQDIDRLELVDYARHAFAVRYGPVHGQHDVSVHDVPGGHGRLSGLQPAKDGIADPVGLAVARGAAHGDELLIEANGERTIPILAGLEKLAS